MRTNISENALKGVGRDGAEHTLFDIEVVETDGRSWHARHRFSEFVDLRDELIRTGCAIVEDLEFPSRKLWGSSSSETS